MQCITLLQLYWNKQQGHAQCQYESVTEMSSLCSLAVAFCFIQSCGLYVNVNCVCIYYNGTKSLANLYAKLKAKAP